MKTKIYILLFTSLLFQACQFDTGRLKTIDKDLESFDELELKSNFDVEIKKSDHYQITIQDGERQIEKVTYELAGGKLVLDRESGFFYGNHPDAKITIYTPESINLLSLSGSGSIYSEEYWEYPLLNCEISGSGDIQLKGVANTCKINISGSGDLMLAKMKTMEAAIQINGSGSVEIHASKKLKVQINGSGNVEYTGSPELEEQINGSGSISKL